MLHPPARLSFLLALACIFLMLPRSGSGAEGFELTEAQRGRLAKYLPNTLPKLDKKLPVRVLIVGDGVMDMTVHTKDDSDTLKSFAGIFLGKLSDQFYYTGGLRVLQPKRGKPEKSLQAFGREITVQNASRRDGTMIHAMNLLAATAWKDKPDLVIISFGINDAAAKLSLATYRRAVQDCIMAVKNNGADLMLIGATPTPKDPPEEGLALTRPYVDTMREVAQVAGVFFADLGDISWLVRVDEPMKELEAPATKKPRKDDDVKEKIPDAGVKIPLPDELDPDPDKRAARLFLQVTENLRRWFDHGGKVDPVHPNTAMHKMLGRRLFSELLDGPRATPWSIGSATARLTDSDHCQVSYRIENTTGSIMRLNLLPLVTKNWKPKEAETQIELKAGGKSLVTMTYVKNGTSSDGFPPHETFLRLPVMMLANGVARIEDIRARLQSLTVLWNLGTQFNQEGGTTLTGRIINPSPDVIEGKWHAEWLGQKFSGEFKTPANGETPVKINVRLPADLKPPFSQHGNLAFTVTTKNLTLQFSRKLEIVQNLGLKQAYALAAGIPHEKIDPGATSPPSPVQAQATIKVDADPKALYFTWDIKGTNLCENSSGVALTADINIDARSYGKRLGHGVTDTLRVTTGAADGPGNIVSLKAWAFGNDYAVEYSRNLAQAVLSSRPDGSRRLTLMLPRSIFHLHEWALGNGNSQLGLNSRVGIWQAPDARNPGGTDLSFSLFDNGLHRDDAESLAALELSAQPTRRWTVHFY